MAGSMNISPTDELRDFINSHAGNRGLYATPSEYLRDLIHRDMARSYRSLAPGDHLTGTSGPGTGQYGNTTWRMFRSAIDASPLPR